MNLNELLEMLDLTEPSEFEYFENFADLVESDEEIPEETLAELFSEVDISSVTEIIDNYFSDLTSLLSDGYPDIYSLLYTIKNVLIALINDDSDEGSLMRFAEEIGKFKTWYCCDSGVYIRDSIEGKESNLTLRDALTQMRLEKIDDVQSTYDFSVAMEYDIDEYLLDMAGSSRNYEFEDGSENLLDYGYGYEDETLM